MKKFSFFILVCCTMHLQSKQIFVQHLFTFQILTTTTVNVHVVVTKSFIFKFIKNELFRCKRKRKPSVIHSRQKTAAEGKWWPNQGSCLFFLWRNFSAWQDVLVCEFNRDLVLQCRFFGRIWSQKRDFGPLQACRVPNFKRYCLYWVQHISRFASQWTVTKFC